MEVKRPQAQTWQSDRMPRCQSLRGNLTQIPSAADTPHSVAHDA